MSKDEDQNHSFSGFEVARTQRPENSNVVVAACFRRAANHCGQLMFRDGSSYEDPDTDKRWDQRGAETYQPERWSKIEEALRATVTQVALVNSFAEPEVQRSVRAWQHLESHQEIPYVCECPGQRLTDSKAAAAFRTNAFVADDHEGPAPRPGAALRSYLEAHALGAPPSLLPCCFLSGASVLAAQALRVRPGEKVLDLCAGPGAKALALASALLAPEDSTADPLEQVGVEAGLLSSQSHQPHGTSAHGGLLVCNEPQRQRAALLEGALASWVPGRLLGKEGRVLVTRAEASARVPPALRKHAPFDKVLVDAPCTPGRSRARGGKGQVESDGLATKRNAELAEELLRCAGALVRPGGLVVYCTSSLTEGENDEVILKFLRRSGGEFTVEAGEDDVPMAGAEQTELGTLILPDQGTLHGPLYFARLWRSAA
mmetsp:Transcript_107160/g.303027  ORF Transcript_107160/g.303027 Transcript_107160/m.303027 type:complete len:430 (-) Transcript_107160:109-1398(-)|eukprot:CAMPEP_0168362426 /NCGR_PEP_ID=MMETSP0228-20121227/3171_1 /TAXON_ID=133427 /ORGANISM="Protoceratium reticulatum, Strain CCCM 535 (=CCMP 1889)" /LENGTH=429 /DNA_ID=CAMNT_0008375125 /DNA_START=67 /DNA_END=1356 /DNA_ORIENTATION=-